MAATAPPVITALPAPPDPNDRSTFNTRAYPWSVAQQTLATEVGAVAANVYANATEAAAQAELATTNGAAQVALAAAQAELATTNGAAQVALAAEQAELAIAQAVAAALSADAARSIANFAGVWSTLTGPLNKPATVYHAGLFYVLVNNLASVSASEPGVTADWIASPGGMPSYTYDQRGDLRASSGQFAVVDGLGLFQHVAGSDEPDDDESCFATATGRWLLQAVHWDVVGTWQLPDDEARDAYDEGEPLRFAASFAAKILSGTATCAVTTVADTSSVAFTGTVAGAAPGDRVIATPPAALGKTDADSGRLSYHAWVSAADTVAVRLTNASAAAATTNTAIQTAWPITVIKS